MLRLPLLGREPPGGILTLTYLNGHDKPAGKGITPTTEVYQIR